MGAPRGVSDVEHSPNVTTVRGVDTLLNCRVHQLTNMTVSWIKHGGVHLLAVGRYIQWPQYHRFLASSHAVDIFVASSNLYGTFSSQCLFPFLFFNTVILHFFLNRFYGPSFEFSDLEKNNNLIPINGYLFLD